MKQKQDINSGISINESRHRCTFYVHVHKDNENLYKTELIIGKVCILFIFMYDQTSIIIMKGLRNGKKCSLQ